MGLDIVLRGVEIGVERIEIVNKMTELLALADTKDDFLYILEKMNNELEEGIHEIDQMLSPNTEEIS